MKKNNVNANGTTAPKTNTMHLPTGEEVRPAMLMQVSRTEVRIDSLTSQTLSDLTKDVKALQAVGKKATLLIAGRIGYMIDHWDEYNIKTRTALNYAADEFGYSKQTASAMNRVYQRFIQDGATATLTIDGDWSFGQLMEMLPMTDEEITTYIETDELRDSMSAVKIRGLAKDAKAARNAIDTTAKEEPVKEEPVKEEPVKEEPVKEETVKEEPVKEEHVKGGEVVPTKDETKAHTEFAKMLIDLYKKTSDGINTIADEKVKAETFVAFADLVKSLGYDEMISVLAR